MTINPVQYSTYQAYCDACHDSNQEPLPFPVWIGLKIQDQDRQLKVLTRQYQEAQGDGR